MANKSPTKQITLLTNSFLEYYHIHHRDSLDYLLEKYSYQLLEGIGVEFHNISIDDENYIEETEKEFLKYESSN